MRDIKFRGQRSDNKEWIFGFYQYTVYSKSYQRDFNLNQDDAHHIYPAHIDSSPKEVLPETVGQFTGLKDKNGVDIYEGDIVKVLFNQNSDNYSGNNFNYTDHVCTVEFGEYSCRFVLRNFTEKYKSKHNFTTIGFDHRRFQRDLIEVIGNIHSNPELLNNKS